MRPNLRRLAWLACVPFGIAGCAAAQAPSAGEMRVLVKTVQPGGEPGAIAALAAQVSGHAARYVGASGGDWHALASACSGPDDCDAALRRLAADGTRFAAAQRDGRKTVVSP